MKKKKSIVWNISSKNLSTPFVNKIQSILGVLYFLLKAKNYYGSENRTKLPSTFIIKNPSEPESVYLRGGWNTVQVALIELTVMGDQTA